MFVKGTRVPAVALAVICLGAFAARAGASTVYVQVDGSGFDSVSASATEPGPGAGLPTIGISTPDMPFTHDEPLGANGAFLEETAHPVAGPGFVKSTAELDTLIPPAGCRPTCGRSLSSYARFILDDVVVTATAGAGASTVPARVNLDLDGRLFADAINPDTLVAANVCVDYWGLPGAASSEGLDDGLDAQVVGFASSPRSFLAAVHHFDRSCGENTFPPPPLPAGIFAPFAQPVPGFADSFDVPIDLHTSTDSFAVPVGSPFTIGFGLLTVASVGRFGAGTAAPYGRAQIDFPATLRLAASRPVFDLPAGYTANSAGGLIVDNHVVAAPPVADTTPPALSCAGPDGAWHAANVTLACTASYDGSGLASAVDASFTLATDVPDGTETADAATASRRVCDTAGNCATAGPIAGNKVDREKPSIAVTAPAADAAYELDQPVDADYTCSDGGSGVTACTGDVSSGAAIATGAVGPAGFTVVARDAAGNETLQRIRYTVGYRICLVDPTKPKKAGSTIPVKLVLCDARGTDVSAPAIALSGLAIDDVPARATGNGRRDGTFRFAADLGASGGYIVNLDTKGMPAGVHMLGFRAGADPTVHHVEFRLT
jgi:hypothetical protein